MHGFQRFLGQTVLVTGASGFLGSHLCERLVGLGAQVHAVSRSDRKGNSGDLHWIRGDFGDIDTARRIISDSKPDVVFHLAGLVTAQPDAALVLPTLQSHLVSSVNVLLVALEQGCRRVILTGSLTEPSPAALDPLPASPYAAAKWSASIYAKMFFSLYQAPVVIVRPFMTYGPKQDCRKLIPHVILSLLRNESPKISSGEWQADWIYVDDITDGFLAAAIAPGIEGCSFDLGTGVVTSTRAIVEEIVKLIGTEVSPVFGALPDRPFEPVRIAELGLAHSRLSWKAKTTISEGLKRTIDWYKNHLSS
jgi:nucleoside-diphosphate-sugar epimerase